MVGGFVLAGGASSRMGQDKSMLKLHGRSLLEIAVEKTREVCGNVAVLCGPDPSRTQGLAEAVMDLHGECGPLGGIEAALAKTTFDWNLFLPVDTPLLPEELLSAWVREACSEGMVASILSIEGKWHPLPLLLHKSALESIQASIAAGRFRLRTALTDAASATAQRLEEAEVSTLLRRVVSSDELAEWFANANTPEEFQCMESGIRPASAASRDKVSQTASYRDNHD
ncbi:molybdenum cofactor guanylyltransferase [Terriglobus saanensis]|uniref:Probable molybdenum cofactor guanylyltransferase n=1 Tax=Terriglobus saanensis (strain ATCC BAA-1853 / DSM 23119 / SP1PR4) TaxID=401053 RepID=E8V0B5_TERSS|nr:molybdenum cofactor guanylyltransferase [Terriglobus saanensis]ADV83333.1 putative molybdopterin-guanine dinucleotide biosynthesis protein A [Terriglobus saanensis SP1PR4]